MANIRAYQPKVEHYVFAKEPILVNSRLSDTILQDLKAVHRDGPFRMADFATTPDHFFGGVLIAMRSYLLASTHKETATLSVRTPATWWDHLKHDMLMSKEHKLLRWVVSHCAPPAYKYESKEVVKETRMCPHNNSYIQDDEQHAHFLSWKIDLNDDNKVGD